MQPNFLASFLVHDKGNPVTRVLSEFDELLHRVDGLFWKNPE
jgi:hypothetical protein